MLFALAADLLILRPVITFIYRSYQADRSRFP
jgi:hypothetical protein